MNPTKKIPLYVYFIEGVPGYNNDDPTKCTAVRSVCEGNFVRIKQIPKKCIVLDVTADKYLEPADEIYSEKGLCVIDGPWYIMPETVLELGEEYIFRKLPESIATNPHHKGTTLISSVEATALALKILGKNDQAKEILKPFPWAKNYLKINKV